MRADLTNVDFRFSSLVVEMAPCLKRSLAAFAILCHAHFKFPKLFPRFPVIIYAELSTFAGKPFFMSITGNLEKIRSTLPAGVKLVAVSKTKPNNVILEAYRAGQHVFGENKVQELVAKYEALPKNIEWHFIGHLQTNKVKYLAPFVSMIHAVDSLKLLKFINKEAAKNNRVIDCLLQFHIAQEESKFGLSVEAAREMLTSEMYQKMENVRIKGVMGMATFTDNKKQVSDEFKLLKNIFGQLKTEFFSNDPLFCELSMGMSDDYLLAVEQGSTIVRIGSTIFGAREYH
jgi:hypothetical protein